MPYPQTPASPQLSQSEPYYGVPGTKHYEHMMKCPRCKRNARQMTRCPSYAALDREFYRQHIANGGAAERHFSAPKIEETAPCIAPATDGSDLRERS